MPSTIDTTRTLVAVARLLDHATTRAYAAADADGALSPLYSFALGVQLAACEAAYLLPPGSDLGEAPLEKDPLLLLHAAEELLRDVPVTTPVAAHLVVAVCDLIREATP
jgi:hypothetical protein